MKILISAAEASSDLHGSHLLRALRAKTEVQAFGVGGPKLREAGLESIVDARELLSMGFSEILGRLPRILRALDQVVEAAALQKPDIAVVIDYPDFHFRLAARLQKLGIPVVYYIPPKVWAWRKGRIKKLKKIFAKVLCIFPFEVEFFKKSGLDVEYVGNPLLDELPLDVTRIEARVQLGLAADRPVITCMPGSRPSELDWHLEIVLDAALLVAEGLKLSHPLDVLIPLPVTCDRAEIQDRLEHWKKSDSERKDSLARFKISQGDSSLALIASNGALIKSGTSTLEAAVLNCPHVVLYKASKLTWLIFKYLIRYRGPIALSNLVAGKKAGDSLLASEWIGPYATPENLAAELLKILNEPTHIEFLSKEFKRVREILSATDHRSPSENAADEILKWVGRK